jgi:hypothetical protein
MIDCELTAINMADKKYTLFFNDNAPKQSSYKTINIKAHSTNFKKIRFDLANNAFQRCGSYCHMCIAERGIFCGFIKHTNIH